MILRGASEGPLKQLIPVFVDVETFVSVTVNLKQMTLRQYLAQSDLQSIALAIGEMEPEAFLTPNGDFSDEDAGVLDLLHALAKDPAYVFVAHNAAFDIRVLRFKLEIPQPQNVWCTMEGAMGAWPELPGGYSLENIPDALCFDKSLRKWEIDLTTCTDDERKNYNCQDVRVMQEVYYRQIASIPGVEQEVALRTHRQRRFYFHVDQTRLRDLTKVLTEQTVYAEKAAEEYVTPENIKNIFNRDDGPLRSVRSKRLLSVINNEMGGRDFKSTSLKKINPVALAKHPQIAGLLVQTSQVSKALSHLRRSRVFIDVDVVDVELAVFRAHTFRFSSPSVGVGLNLHNQPKHNPAIAKPVREMFRLPKELCFVRADLANVEYRTEGILTGCKTVNKMFDPTLGGDIMSDPYCKSWQAMTRQTITKKSPIRQVAKAAVLGLGFCLGPSGYARQSLLPAIADQKSGVTEEILMKIALELGWRDPGWAMQKIITDLGCSPIVALSAYHVHKSFNEAHWEFSMIADWIVRAVSTVGSCSNKDKARFALDKMYTSNRAPNRNLIDLRIDGDTSFSTPSIRVGCGPWVPTLCWRDPKVRPIPSLNGRAEMQLSIIKSTGIIKPFLRPLGIENVTQAAARNMLCFGVAELEKLGHPDVIHVHDELLVITERKREAVLSARDALLQIFGPKGRSPLGWATLIKPDEISVSESMWDDEMDIALPKFNEKTGQVEGGDRWGKIERNDPGCLENLP